MKPLQNEVFDRKDIPRTRWPLGAIADVVPKCLYFAWNCICVSLSSSDTSMSEPSDMSISTSSSDPIFDMILQENSKALTYDEWEVDAKSRNPEGAVTRLNTRSEKAIAKQSDFVWIMLKQLCSSNALNFYKQHFSHRLLCDLRTASLPIQSTI